jgi:hypothetical protein
MTNNQHRNRAFCAIESSLGQIINKNDNLTQFLYSNFLAVLLCLLLIKYLSYTTIK